MESKNYVIGRKNPKTNKLEYINMLENFVEAPNEDIQIFGDGSLKDDLIKDYPGSSLIEITDDEIEAYTG